MMRHKQSGAFTYALPRPRRGEPFDNDLEQVPGISLNKEVELDTLAKMLKGKRNGLLVRAKGQPP